MRIAFIGLMLMVLLTTQVQAGNYVYRTFDNPQNIISGKIKVRLSVDYSGSAGDESYSGSETVYIPVNLMLKIAGDATLRPGERESFTIKGREGSGSKVNFKLISDTVYEYDIRQVSDLEPLSGMKKHGISFIPTVTFILTPTSRKKITPPMTVSEVNPTFGGANDPVAIEFLDVGEELDGNATTNYRFSIHRIRSMWFDVEVAKGELAGSTEAIQRLIITPDCNYLTGKEYFIPGKRYRITIALKKNGPDYVEDWTSSREFEFTCEPGGPAYSRDTMRTLLFNKLRTE